NRRAMGDYGTRLLEKQKLRWYYDVSERALRRYWELARRRPGRTGAELVALLETRLASLVLRSGTAPPIYAARQYVTHGHICVDGRKVSYPGYEVKPGPTVSVRERSRGQQPFDVAAAGVHAHPRPLPRRKPPRPAVPPASPPRARGDRGTGGRAAHRRALLALTRPPPDPGSGPAAERRGRSGEGLGDEVGEQVGVDALAGEVGE